jgi:hypothetical protein
MVFDVSMATRRDDARLRDELDQALVRRAAVIAAILREFDVPLVAAGGR